MRQNPHVRICGGPGSATTLVYPTVSGRGRRPTDVGASGAIQQDAPPVLTGNSSSVSLLG